MAQTSIPTSSWPTGRGGHRALVFGLVLLAGDPSRGATPEVHRRLEETVRHPEGLALSPDGARLYVANRRTGTVSIIALDQGRTVAEPKVGRGLTAIEALTDGKRLLAVDQVGDALILLVSNGNSVRVTDRLKLAADPCKLLVAPGGESCVVASSLSRRLTCVDISPVTNEPGTSLSIGRTIDLPFSPRELLMTRGGDKLIVADAFGGKLAVVDWASGRVESTRALPAHNIRGLAISPDGRELVVAHQVLRRRAKTDFEDVHWGRLLTSHIRSFRMDSVLSPGSDTDPLLEIGVIDLGSPYDGAADPSGLVYDRPGLLAIALEGVGQISVGRGPSSHFRRIAIGGRPTALLAGKDGATLYVADASRDAVHVVEVGSDRRLQRIELGPRPPLSVVEQGEQLFHDARLSLDGWMSCHSCHTDGHTSGQFGDTLGDDSYGAPKRIPSLLGVGSTGPWAWTGTSTRLEDQVRKSIERTMRGRRPSDDQVQAITAYLRSLPAPRRGDRSPAPAAALRGRALFQALDCGSCHSPPDFTSSGRYDVGLVDEAGNREFNPPSLRGVGIREPLLHDGRASNLEEVFLKIKHPLDNELNVDQVADLVAYLKTL